MTSQHEAFGLTIRSDRTLTGLPLSQATKADLEIEFAEGRAPEVDPRAPATTATTGWGSTRETADGGRVFRLVSHDGERMWSMHVAGDGRTIEVRWRGDLELADVTYFVEVAGITAALALRGVPMLHASAVEVDGSAFLVVGPGGAGKSTLAAAAVARGYALLSDDVSALQAGPERGVCVHVAARLLRMHEDSARVLGWDHGVLEPLFVTPGMAAKQFVRLSATDGSLADGSRPVAAIFMLRERVPGAARIERLTATQALPLVLSGTFGEGVADVRTRARLLPFWTRLVREVPIYIVSPSDEIGRVGELVDALADYSR